MTNMTKSGRARLDGTTSWSEEGVTAEARTDRGEPEVQLGANGDPHAYFARAPVRPTSSLEETWATTRSTGRHYVAGDGRLRHMNPHGPVKGPRG
jgi:hypothetical protein